jgi:MoaA/NifB/PqqE/SkfB family radical SAM enzyme
MLFRNFKSGIKLLNHKFTNRKIPIKVNLILTYTCNRNCLYCNISSKCMTKNIKENRFVEIRNIIDELKKNGCDQITLIGGEPLLHPDILEIINYIKEKKFLLAISTNSDYFYKIMKSISPEDILITCLNGNEQTHDFFRGKGNYQNVLNLLKFNSVKSKKIVTCVLSKKNLNQVKLILSLSRKYKFWCNFQPLFENDLTKIDSSFYNKYKLSDSERKKIFQDLLEFKEINYPIINSKKYLRNLIINEKFNFKKCYQGKLTFTIDPYGNLFQCYRDIDISNIKIIKNRNLNMFPLDKIIKNFKVRNCNVCEYGCYAQDNFIYELNLQSIINLLRFLK